MSFSSLCPSALAAKPLEHQIPLRQLPKITLGGICLQTTFYTVCRHGCCQLLMNNIFMKPKKLFLFTTNRWHLRTACCCCWQPNTDVWCFPQEAFWTLTHFDFLFGAKRTKCQGKLTLSGYCSDQWGYGASLGFDSWCSLSLHVTIKRSSISLRDYVSDYV